MLDTERDAHEDEALDVCGLSYELLYDAGQGGAAVVVGGSGGDPPGVCVGPRLPSGVVKPLSCAHQLLTLYLRLSKIFSP